MAKKFFEAKGIKMAPPSSIFLNGQNDTLMVRGSMTNVDTIETLVTDSSEFQAE